MKTIFLFCALLLFVGSITAQQAPIATSPTIELQGKIRQVQILPGQGMPYLEVEDGGKTVKVILGSMRYLMEQNFNPKVGEEISVKGYQLQDAVVAITAQVRGSDQVLKLRDENGWPMWRGGMRRRGQQ